MDSPNVTSAASYLDKAAAGHCKSAVSEIVPTQPYNSDFEKLQEERSSDEVRRRISCG